MKENRFVADLRPLLSAEDEERRAIERALHDGPQQRLIALAVTLQLVRRSLESDDPGAAAAHLDEARIVVGEALEELRLLADQLYPSLLDAQGLDAALRTTAARASVPARIDAVSVGDLPRLMAVTIHSCVAAALAAVRGDAAVATVSLRTGGSSISFDVTLDGGAFDPARLEASRVRVEILGGALAVHPRRVAGRVPVGS